MYRVILKNFNIEQHPPALFEKQLEVFLKLTNQGVS